MKIYELEMGDYSLRVLKTSVIIENLEELDVYYYNRGIELHVFSCTPLTEQEYNAHREHYSKMPVDIF